MALQTSKQIQNQNQQFEQPNFEVLGALDSIVLNGGANNDDGWYYTPLPFFF